MANGFGTLYVGQSGLVGAQNALNTTANNLANVNTKGYVRQQVRYVDKTYSTIKDAGIRTNMQQSGLGVSIGDVVHARDVFLDKAFRQENGREAFYSKCSEVTSYVEDLLQELDGEEFQGSIQDLYQAISEIAKDPSDSTVQNLLLQKCELLLSRSSALYSDVKSYQSNLDLQISQDVDRINEIGERIYELNLQIQKVEAGGVETAMTLRDERDLLLDELSGYVKVEASEDATGFVFVDIEGAEFITERGASPIGMLYDTETGFSNPYWVERSNANANEYMFVFDTKQDACTDNNTDIGSTKALIIQRGDGFADYTDLADADSYNAISGSSLLVTEAEIDQLFHKIATTINDLYCPNTDIAGQETELGLTTKLTLTSEQVSNEATYKLIGAKSESNTYYSLGTDNDGREIVVAVEGEILDVENANYGSDMELPPREIFTRNNKERYEAVALTVNGETKTVYVYNAEDPDDPDSQYHINNVSINAELKKQITLLPAYKKNGEVAYDLGHNLANAWDEATMTLNPLDANPVSFEQYYNKMVGDLATTGNVYQSNADTLTATTASLENSRTQVTGVNSDEELTNMVKYQSAYNAASRFMTVISDMTETIVGLI